MKVGIISASLPLELRAVLRNAGDDPLKDITEAIAFLKRQEGVEP